MAPREADDNAGCADSVNNANGNSTGSNGESRQVTPGTHYPPTQTPDPNLPQAQPSGAAYGASVHGVAPAQREAGQYARQAPPPRAGQVPSVPARPVEVMPRPYTPASANARPGRPGPSRE